MNRIQSYPKLMSECNEGERLAAQDYLSGYVLCKRMLQLRSYERKRAAGPDAPTNVEQLLQANEQHWEVQMIDIKSTVDNLRNGREKMILYYHFIRGESVSSAARLVGISRRSGYRMLEKGLAMVALVLRKREETLADFQKEAIEYIHKRQEELS